MSTQTVTKVCLSTNAVHIALLYSICPRIFQIVKKNSGDPFSTTNIIIIFIFPLLSTVLFTNHNS